MTKVINKIKERLQEVEDNELYRPQEIEDIGVILNTKQEASKYTIYRLIKNGELEALNLNSGGVKPKYFIKGKDLKEFVKKRYKITN